MKSLANKTAEAISDVNRINALSHSKALEGAEYLAMKDAMASGACCKNCIDYKPRQYVAICRYPGHLVKSYNICTKYQKIGEKK